MSSTKVGRPTKSVKEDLIKARIDSDLKEKLELCAAKLGCSKSEIVRLGIENIFKQLNGEIEKWGL